MAVLVFLSLLTLLVEGSLDAKSSSEVEGVENAVRDYLHAFYDAEPSRLERSLDSSLDKVGLARKSADQPYAVKKMSFTQALELSAVWNKDDRSVDPKSALQKIEVLGIYPKVACAKLTAAWGIDYFHLVRHGKGWKIHHVLWQSHPGKPGAAYKPNDKDLAAVRQAGNDYIDSFYKVKPELLDGSVDKELKKLGLYRPSPKAAFQPAPMDFASLKELAHTAFASQKLPADAVRGVRVIDLLDCTGVLEVRGVWGVDFVSVAKIGGTWKIRQVIWQSYPTPEEMATVAAGPGQ